MTAQVALIAGAGGVLGEALVQAFSAAGHRTAALRRSSRPPAGGTSGYHVQCDLTDPVGTQHALADALAALGPIDTLVYNAAHLVAAPFEASTLTDFEAAWRTSVLGAVACAQAVLPGMLQRGHGAMVFVGATASRRGSAGFAAFASAKFALRGLAQSLAREYQPRGIHVAHLVLDGLLRGSASAGRFGAGQDTTIHTTIDPAEAARTCLWLAQQPPSAWTHEIDMRPNSERF